MTLLDRLKNFEDDIGATGKGALSVLVQLTETAQKEGLPLDPESLKTSKAGQVKGLGGGRLRRILAKNGIDRQLSSEAGRTSRGSMETMQRYVCFLNELEEDGIADLMAVEAYWVSRVNDYFAREPFKLKLDSSLSFRAVVRNLLSQALERQRAGGGAMIVGTMMQHLVGAKLEVAMSPGGVKITHHGANVSDAQGRGGDFDINSLSIHVTASPSEALALKCKDNLSKGRRPIIVTNAQSVDFAASVCDAIGIEERVDILEVEQFLATNIYEIGLFDEAQQKSTVEDIIEVYNRIIDEVENTPSLKIELAEKNKATDLDDD